jgi:hypothetical protein
MTPASTVAAQLDSALATLTGPSGLPNARIFVASIPNVYHLWQIFHTNFAADFVWSIAGICQSLLANPTSTSTADQNRRTTVLNQVKADNDAIAATCQKYIQCRFDNYATFGVNFTTSQVTTRDYFHPSVSGQNLAANIEAAASFTFGP